MNTSSTNEQAFEQLIEKALVGTSAEDRKMSGLTDIDAQQPDAEHYYWGSPKDMDKKTALDLRRLFAFLRSSQQEVLDSHVGSTWRPPSLRRLPNASRPSA